MSKKDHGLTLVPRSSDVDGLYQLPLDQFTPARNALAKRIGKADPSVRSLEKPSVAAWAINQLYWRERPLYDRLMEASERLRAEHRKLLAGKGADVRVAEQAHREAIRAASDSIKNILSNGDQAGTPATLSAVAETLAALPADVVPGRLTRPLKPMGFEALTGVPPRPPQSAPPRRGADTTQRGAPARDPAAEKRAAEAARREEAREKERLDADVRRAKAALDKAQAAMARAEEDVAACEKALGEARKTRDRLQVEATLAVNEHQHAVRRARG